MRRPLTCCLVALLVPAAAHAADQTAVPPQPSPGLSAVYVTLGGGFSQHGPAGYAAFSLEFGRLLVSARAAGTAEISVMGNDNQSARDYGAMVGVVQRTGSSSFSAAAGLGWMDATIHGAPIDGNTCCTDYQMTHGSGLGVPFALSTMYHGRAGGIGVSLFGNLNRELIYVAAGLTVDVGLL